MIAGNVWSSTEHFSCQCHGVQRVLQFLQANKLILGISYDVKDLGQTLKQVKIKCSSEFVTTPDPEGTGESRTPTCSEK